ncbi:MAG TPA: PaaI family thioesterase [Myxococcaceae bacterium]|nr:PaaI family thioesterase [Myxococcaceae bacterium]
MNRTRTFSWQDPLLTSAAAEGRTGLEFLRALIAEKVPPPPIANALDFKLVDASDGYARFEGTAAEFHYNPIGVVHGGVACTLLDSAMGCAVMSTLDARHAYTTVQLNVNLTRPITRETGRLIAEARIVHRGSRISTADGKLVDAAGKLLAHASTTCMIFDRPQSRN